MSTSERRKTSKRLLTFYTKKVSQSKFPELLGVPLRTLQESEQGRRAPSGAARTLLRIAAKSPQALIEVA